MLQKHALLNLMHRDYPREFMPATQLKTTVLKEPRLDMLISKAVQKVPIYTKDVFNMNRGVADDLKSVPVGLPFQGFKGYNSGDGKTHRTQDNFDPATPSLHDSPLADSCRPASYCRYQRPAGLENEQQSQGTHTLCSASASYRGHSAR